MFVAVSMLREFKDFVFYVVMFFWQRLFGSCHNDNDGTLNIKIHWLNKTLNYSQLWFMFYMLSYLCIWENWRVSESWLIYEGTRTHVKGNIK